MTEHHLSNTYRTSPSNVIIDVDLYISWLSILLLNELKKSFNLFGIIFQQRGEVASIAVPDQRRKVGVKAVWKAVYLVRNLRFVNIYRHWKNPVQKMYRQVLFLLNFYFFCTEEFHERIHNLATEKVCVALRCLSLHHIPCRKCFPQIFVLTLWFVEDDHSSNTWTQINLFLAQEFRYLRNSTTLLPHLLRCYNLVAQVAVTIWLLQSHRHLFFGFKFIFS